MSDRTLRRTAAIGAVLAVAVPIGWAQAAWADDSASYSVYMNFGGQPPDKGIVIHVPSEPLVVDIDYWKRSGESKPFAVSVMERDYPSSTWKVLVEFRPSTAAGVRALPADKTHVTYSRSPLTVVPSGYTRTTNERPTADLSTTPTATFGTSRITPLGSVTWQARLAVAVDWGVPNGTYGGVLVHSLIQ